MGTDASVDVNRFLFFLVDFFTCFLFLKSGVYETCERLFVLVRDLLRCTFLRFWEGSRSLFSLGATLRVRDEPGVEAATRSDETF